MTLLAPSPELAPTPSTPNAKEKRSFGAILRRPVRRPEQEVRIDVPVSLDQDVKGRHRATIGRLAYGGASATGNQELIETAEYLKRRQDGGDPTAAKDIKAFRRLITTEREDPYPLNMNGTQDFMMPAAERPSTSDVLHAYGESANRPTDTLTVRDFIKNPDYEPKPDGHIKNLPTGILREVPPIDIGTYKIPHPRDPQTS